VPYNGRIVSFDDRLRDALDRALAGTRAELERDVRALAEELQHAAQAQPQTAGLASAIQKLDGAGSLSDVLHALLDGAAEHADEVGLFLVRDGRVRPWRRRGADAAGPTAPAADSATAFPVTVGGQVVAILYVDRLRSASAAIEVLTRYAGRLLESMTLHTALGLTPPQHVRSPATPDGGANLR